MNWLAIVGKVRAVRTVVSGSRASVRNGGEGWGEEALRKGDTVCMGGAPLSPALSPFVPHGPREMDALLVTVAPARTFAAIGAGRQSRRKPFRHSLISAALPRLSGRGPSPRIGQPQLVSGAATDANLCCSNNSELRMQQERGYDAPRRSGNFVESLTDFSSGLHTKRHDNSGMISSSHCPTRPFHSLLSIVLFLL